MRALFSVLGTCARLHSELNRAELEGGACVRVQWNGRARDLRACDERFSGEDFCSLSVVSHLSLELTDKQALADIE